ITVSDFTDVNSLADSNLTVSFSTTVNARTVPNGGWNNWASPPQTESPTPRVLFTSGTTVTLSFSKGVSTFGVEMEPNFGGTRTMTADFYNGATLEGEIALSVNNFEGAQLFAATTTDQFTKVVLSAPASARGFALAQVRYPLQPPTVTCSV